MKNYCGFPIQVIQGADFGLPIYYQDPGGSPVDLDGYSAKMQIRQTRGADNPPLVECGISIDEPTGLIFISISHTVTAVLAAPMKAVYDLFVTPPNGEKIRLLWGNVAIIERVTR